ncbi:MAG: hypothetical protein HRF40_12615 [Nitrososphaera sp.]|jgi:vacuolar-type H+-ATPase subunit H
MAQSPALNETTRLENSTFNLITALNKEASFLYSTVDTYINDARKDNRPDLVRLWDTIKKDKEKHIQMLRESLSKDAKEERFR